LHRAFQERGVVVVSIKKTYKKRGKTMPHHNGRDYRTKVSMRLSNAEFEEITKYKDRIENREPLALFLINNTMKLAAGIAHYETPTASKE
jgi:hypothetical protein